MIKLRDYQEDISNGAAKSLVDHKLAYLAMQPRTGKSITAYESITKAGFKSVLVVSKKKALSGLMKDYSHYTTKFKASFINYESLHKVDGDFDVILVDEAHSIGAFPKPSDRTRNLKKIAKGKAIIYLSATPSPESFSQIYHQFWISSYSPFNEGSFYGWAKTFVDVKQRKIAGRMVNDYSKANEDLIDEKCKHLFFDKTQAGAGFDVAIKEEIIYSPLSPAQHHLIRKLKNDQIFEGKGGGVVIADTAVKLQQKVHQICSGTIKLECGKRVVINDAKAKILKKRFDGQKIVIFYKFIAEFEMLKSVFENWTSDQDEFQESDDKVYLGQFISSREGVRLDTADAIVFLNIDFSYLSYAQARERIISKERTKEAILYWVFSIDGIEEKIFKTVKGKKNYTVHYFKKDYYE